VGGVRRPHLPRQKYNTGNVVLSPIVTKNRKTNNIALTLLLPSGASGGAADASEATLAKSAYSFLPMLVAKRYDLNG
jgi:hypothetical protein